LTFGKSEYNRIGKLGTRQPPNGISAGNGTHFRLNLRALKWTEKVKRKKAAENEF
jgi:hypothetical protein